MKLLTAPHDTSVVNAQAPLAGSSPYDRHHPSMYKPPASYSELLSRMNAQPEPSALPPANTYQPAVPAGNTDAPSQATQHKAPSLAKILKGGSMLSITHVQVLFSAKHHPFPLTTHTHTHTHRSTQDPQENLPFGRPVATAP